LSYFVITKLKKEIIYYHQFLKNLKVINALKMNNSETNEAISRLAAVCLAGMALFM